MSLESTNKIINYIHKTDTPDNTYQIKLADEMEKMKKEMEEKYNRIKKDKEFSLFQLDQHKQNEINVLQQKLNEAISIKEDYEDKLAQENREINDIEGDIKKALEEIEHQEAILQGQRSKKDKIIRHIITDKKTPFVARYTLYQQQLASKRNELNELKQDVLSNLLTYCKEFLDVKHDTFEI